MDTRSRTILAVNPSFQSDVEAEFWAAVAVAADAAGWRLVQVAARRIPDIAKADTITLPAQLRTLERQMSDLPRSELVAGPTWLSERDVELQVEWEHRRHQMSTHVPAVTDGFRRLAWFTERTLELLNPALVLTTNKIDHPCALFRKAALDRHIPVGLIERSPFESIWYEPDGMFAESQIWSAMNGAQLAPGVDRSRRIIADNPAGFRIDEASAEQPLLDSLPRPLVFLPFDNTLWTGWAQHQHPQRSVDNPAYDTPQDAVDDLSNAVAVLGGSLVIKAHPSCHETKHLGLHANTYLVDGALDHLVRHADVVATFNTKIAFLALALGRGTATFAPNPAAATGLTAHWLDHESTLATLRAGLDLANRPRPAAVDSYFTWLADHYFYDVDPSSSRSPRSLVDVLIDRVEGPTEPMKPSAIQRLRRIADGESDAVPIPVRPVGRGRRGTGRVLIDVTRLVDPNAVHSGIAWYGREMLRRLPRLVDGELWAVLREPARGWSVANVELFDELRCAVGGRVIALQANQRFDAVESTIGELTSGDILHSIHLPLPPVDETGPVRRIITIHDVLHLIQPELNPGGTPTIAKVLESIDTDRDFIVCDSHQTWRDVLKLDAISSDRVATVHLGGSTASLLADSREDSVVAVLQTEVRKNTNGVIRAVADTLAQPEFASTRFTAVVSGAASKDVRSALAATALPASRVDLVVSPDDRRMLDVFRSGRVFVFGSVYEGFGLPVLEAMSQGCPTVLPINSSLVEVAGSAACYAASESADDLRVALESVLRDDEYARQLSELARLRTRVLTWEHSATRLAAIYDQVRSRPDEN